MHSRRHQSLLFAGTLTFLGGLVSPAWSEPPKTPAAPKTGWEYYGCLQPAGGGNAAPHWAEHDPVFTILDNANPMKEPKKGMRLRCDHYLHIHSGTFDVPANQMTPTVGHLVPGEIVKVLHVDKLHSSLGNYHYWIQTEESK